MAEDYTKDEINEGKLEVRASPAREKAVRELYGERDLRPSEILERIDHETTKVNFYHQLNRLHESGIVDKIKSGRRFSLYSLTDLGVSVAEELGFDRKSEEESEEEFRKFVIESDLAIEEIEDILNGAELIRETIEEMDLSLDEIEEMLGRYKD